MLNPSECTLYSGGAEGAEHYFGMLAEQYSVDELNYSFDGHSCKRERGLKVLSIHELALKDISLNYASKLMNRVYPEEIGFRNLLQSICWQVSSAQEIFVVGEILNDDTIKGGTGWAAEYSKVCNKPLYVFDQKQKAWFLWTGNWEKHPNVRITTRSFAGTGTQKLDNHGKKAITTLFANSFKK